jgi:tRNA pseudouridine55 synthase
MNGLLLLNKALGLSSNRAMQQVKRLLKASKIGHTGSLDPQASGMLPLCIGEATKFAQYLLDADKTYEVSGRLGIKTTTADIEGDILSEQKVPPLSFEDLNQIILKFQGNILQKPPMYSALKHQGQPLYRYALQGIEIERSLREISIRSIELLDFKNDIFSLRVTSSKGTYMRTLIDDIGDMLGCGAHVVKLHRLSTSGFSPEQMISFELLESYSKDEISQMILPMDVMVDSFPSYDLKAEDALSVLNGQVLAIDPINPGTYRLYNHEKVFIGLGEYTFDKGLAAKRMCRLSFCI